MLFQPGVVYPTIRYIIDSLSDTLIKLSIAIVIFLSGFVLGKLLGRVLYKMLKEIEINKFIKTSTGIKINADHLISNILSISIYFLSLVAALEQLGIANFILYLLSATLIIILLISLFLAIRDFLPNLLAGIYLYRKPGLKEGSPIETLGIKGTLVHIDLFHAKIETKKGDLLFVPNSALAKSEIKITKQKKKKD
ncbi:mechanosensitive ion channel family protein [Candidatus Woesearchaeota archaeon]|nr:mechanosensitive ion channel family protein [Candidatus Woesearchaeota archaeon]